MIFTAWFVFRSDLENIVMVLDSKVSDLAGVSSKVVNIDGLPILSSLKKPNSVVNLAMQEG